MAAFSRRKGGSLAQSGSFTELPIPIVLLSRLVSSKLFVFYSFIKEPVFSSESQWDKHDVLSSASDLIPGVFSR